MSVEQHATARVWNTFALQEVHCLTALTTQATALLL